MRTPSHRATTATTKVWMLIGGVVAAGVLVWSVVAEQPRSGVADRWAWLLLAVAFSIIERFDADLEVAGEVHTVNASDALAVIGLAFLSPFHLLAARAFGDVAGTALWHRDTAPQKAGFNLANHVLECGIAVALYTWALSTSSPVSGRGWLAAFVSVLIASSIGHLIITAAIALATGRSVRSAKYYALQLAILLCNIVMGLIAVNVLWVDTRGAWMIVVGFLIASYGYRDYVKTRERLDNLQAFERFANELDGQTDSAEVTARALRNAAELMRAEQARLVLSTPDGGASVQRLDEQREVATTTYTAEDLPPAIGELMRHRQRFLVAAGDRDAHKRRLADEFGWLDLVCAPFGVEGNMHGALVVGNRLASGSTFDDNDLKLLETFATNTGQALRVGELVEQLRHQAAEKEYQSRHDSLTKLPNRMVADERLRQVLPHATDSTMVAVMFMDLDRFKEVNDALGHHVGDELLKEVAARLHRVIGKRGTVARLGGDEFAVVIPGVVAVDELTILATALRAEVSRPVVIDRLSLNPLASIGIALAPHDGSDARALFQRADVAMYAAKNRRTGFEYYDPRFDKASTRTLSLTADLRTALVTDQLQLHYQPQASLSGQVIGVEALARWPHPRYGSVPPEEFVHVAEQHGLIHQLTRWAISGALADIAEWRKTYPELRVSVNMSARDLMDLSFPSDVERLLREADVPPEALTLELTESKMLSDIRRSVEMLGRLRALGVRLAVDDFGTGQSSLAYLKSLPIHEVKIDRSFVFSMANSADDAVIVRSTIDMAHNLGLTAVAEGVEDADVWRMLVDQQCDSAQGYFITPGLPAREMTRWMATRHELFHLPQTRDNANVIRLVPRAS